MSYIDLHTALMDWTYDPEQISVRKILGADQTVRIQMRVELGIVQLEAEGRPDGSKPHGATTLVDYHKAQLQEHIKSNGTSLGFSLSAEECHDLRIEASIYYRRYVAEFVLEEYEEVVQDTSHNLAIFDLCRDHGLEKDDALCLERFRPYVLMMDARARAYQALQEGEPSSALAHANRGILNLKAFFEKCGRTDAIETCEELKILHALTQELSDQIPADSLVVARKALREAIEHERFEEAARLRDTIKNIYDQGT